MHRILISDPLHPLGVKLLEEAGAEVTVLAPQDKHLLLEKVADVDALIVRSGTQVTAEVLEAGKRLKVVGRAGIGVDNVDVKAATERGILVVNAPTANLISATEHTFALMFHAEQTGSVVTQAGPDAVVCRPALVDCFVE